LIFKSATSNHAAKEKKHIKIKATNLAMSDFEGYHHRVSFILALGSAFFQTVVFAIVVPTVNEYVEMLGYGRWFAGALGATAAFVPGILSPVWRRTEAKLSLKVCFTIVAISQIIGTFLWTQGLTTNSAWILLVSRIFSGVGSPGNCYASYINRGVSASEKSGASTMASVAFLSAYAVGSLIAYILTVIGQKFPVSTDTNSTVYKLFNQYTYPGWVMCFLYVMYLISILTIFTEPPRNAGTGAVDKGKEQSKMSTGGEMAVVQEAVAVDDGIGDEVESGAGNGTKNGGGDSSGETGKKDKKYLFCLAYCIFAFAFCYTGIFSISSATVKLLAGLNALSSTLYLTVLMTVNTIATLCTGFIPQTSDRKTMLWTWGVLLVTTPLAFVVVAENLVGGLGVVNGIAWGTMAIIFVVFAWLLTVLNVVRAADLALCVKVPDAEDRDLVIAVCPAFAFMVGTAIGNLVGLALGSTPMYMIAIIYFFVVSSFVVTFFFYKYLEVPVSPDDENNYESSYSMRMSIYRHSSYIG